jgi:hypothetical protein
MVYYGNDKRYLFLLKCDEFVKNSCNFAPELGDALALWGDAERESGENPEQCPLL